MDSWSRWFPWRQSSDTPQESAKQPSVQRNRALLWLVVLGVFILLLGRIDSPQDPLPQMQSAGIQLPLGNESDTGPEREVERRLAELLSHVANVGRVEVMIQLDRGEEVEYAVDRTLHRTTTEEPAEGEGGIRRHSDERITERPILLRDDQGRRESPLVRTVHQPRMRSAIVIAEGAHDPRVRYELARAVQVYLDLPAHRVEVLARSSVKEP